MKVWHKHIECLTGAVTMFALLLNAFYCPAQLLSNNGQEIFIGDNVPFTIKGDIQNNGTITNRGEITLTGDWDNGGEYIAQEGALVLTGSDQWINHNQQEIYELVIEGKGERHFVSGAAITHNLYLTQGIMIPFPDVKLIGGASLMIRGGSNQSHINGAFYHQGTGEKLYPIGKNGHYSPVTLQLYDDATIGYEVFEPNDAAYFAVEFSKISSLKYWQQDIISGHIQEGSTITLPMSIEGSEMHPEALAIAGATLNEPTYKLLETVEYTGAVNNGHITSYLDPSHNLFAIGLLAESPEERALFIPNAFAPYSPRANEEDSRVKVYGKSISDEGFLFRIYNRWGAVVYETYSYEEAKTAGWNGINSNTGNPETTGSYKYSLKGKFLSGKAIEKTGTIHLIR